MFEGNFKDKLSEIFPYCLKDGQVDFKALIEELGSNHKKSFTPLKPFYGSTPGGVT